MNDFLPKDYKVPDSSNGYMRLAQGKNKFRVVSSAIIGYEFWKTKDDGSRTPVRRRMDEKILTSEIEENPKTGEPESIKHFWAFVVWNYEANGLQILELTQKSIQKAIKAYVDNEDYGDPKGYDITITREGEGLATEYSVIAAPPKKLDDSISKAVENTEINLEALYDGEDPFATTSKDLDVPEDLDDIDFS